MKTCLRKTARNRSGRADLHSNRNRLSDVVIQAEHLRKAFGDKLLFEDLSFTLPRSGIVGIISPNGAGKTTLFKMVTGQEKPDSGTLKDQRDRADDHDGTGAAKAPR